MDGRRPERSPPPASAPFILGAADRPARPQPHHTFTTTTEYSEKEQGPSSLVLSPTGSNPTVPILPRVPGPPGVRFDAAASHPPGSGASGSGAVHSYAAEQGSVNFKRKKSLVRPDRAPVDPSHRLFNYRNHAAAMEADSRGRTGLSTTGAAAVDGSAALGYDGHENDRDHQGLVRQAGVGAIAALGWPMPGEPHAGTTALRRGKSVLARGPGEAEESGLAILKRGETLRRQKSGKRTSHKNAIRADSDARRTTPKKPFSPWMTYCRIITCCFPQFLLSCCGIKTPERTRAWREKIGLLGIVVLLMAAVGFLTFGFTQAVCGKPANKYRAGNIEAGMMIFHGKAYDMDKFQHVGALGIATGDNPLYSTFNASAKDGSFLFQNVNQHCKGVITAASGTGIPTDSAGNLGWYFPCNLYNQYGTSAVNKTGYAQGTMCHTQTDARTEFAAKTSIGDVYYKWSDLNSTRNLAIFDGNVLDLSLLNWLDKSQVSYPALLDSLKATGNNMTNQDITMQLVRAGGANLGNCLVDIIRVGTIESDSLGCLAADTVLYVSLVVILGVVMIKWALAVSFAWFFGWRLGSFGNETAEQRARRAEEIENWTADIYRPAPARYRPNAKNGKRSVLPSTSRFTPAGKLSSMAAVGGGLRPPSMYDAGRKGGGGTPPNGKMLGPGMHNSSPGSPVSGGMRGSKSTMSLPQFPKEVINSHSQRSSMSGEALKSSCPFPLYNVVPQPSADYEPFNFPLAHSILLVTAYSESVEGLRTTLDSLATTDYPNSHKLILVIADGMVRGSGNTMTTPEICLSMMKELVVPARDCEALPYIAIADGHKQYNRAKVYAGFYSYDDNTVESSKQQRVPMVVVSKVGNPFEEGQAKPGNRGKRDSQVLLMSFLQKAMFEERMTALEYEFFNTIWRVTGISPDHYEVCLMVDADTKVFPDSVSRMVCCMVRDPEIMGLCGETKIANKSETWVTRIQVFEYYISHHQTKAFESMFGGVTCLPGCFSMYRIKAPKGDDGYWVPILANPDIVEHYSENIVDSLHAKNLLLLGEDRFLTTLMLKTFPKRKMMFCPQAVCKTIVPDVFRVLLSQRRRWINSTIHNLFELLFVHDLCGTFCFSMQFVIGMELIGTLVLPAAIAFTIYIIIDTIIPGTTKPIVSLILLAFVLGLPGVLIVVTSRKWSYVGWMIIYLFSLPIWNFVLPFYAYLHMDDFTWGATREVAGGKEKAHGDKEGEFDSSNIMMKRWAEWERDRRLRSGIQRDSMFEFMGPTSSPHCPATPATNRYSINSSAETWSNAPTDPYSNRHAMQGGSEESNIRAASLPRSRDHNVQELALPAPLAREGSPSTRPSSTLASPSVPFASPEQHNEAVSSRENLLHTHSGPRPEAAYGPTHDSLEGWSDPEGRLFQDSPSSLQLLNISNLSSAQQRGTSNMSSASTLPIPPDFANFGRPDDGAFFGQERAQSTERGESVPRPQEPLAQPHLRQQVVGVNRGVSLTDSGAVPNETGGYRQVDRPRRQSQGTDKGRRQSQGAGNRNSRASSNYPRPQSTHESDGIYMTSLPQPPMSPISVGSSSSHGGRLPLGLAPPRTPTDQGH